MTRVTMIYDGNVPLGFEMKGHAGYNKNGPDIVCASLSAASQMTVNGLVEWLGVSCDDLIIEQNEVWGKLVVEVPDFLHNNSASMHLLKSFEVYIEQLAEAYPQNVSLERRVYD